MQHTLRDTLFSVQRFTPEVITARHLITQFLKQPFKDKVGELAVSLCPAVAEGASKDSVQDAQVSVGLEFSV